MPRALWVAILFLGLVAAPEASARGAPRFITQPTIAQNPNERVPLAAIVRFEADRPVTTTITLNDGRREWRLEFPSDRYDPQQGLPVAGMRAATAHTVHVTITDDRAQSRNARAALTYTTPALPAIGYDFPPMRVTSTDPTRMEPGVTILSVRRNTPGRVTQKTEAQIAFARRWGMLVAVDAEGEVVWYYRNPERRIAGFDQLANGNFIFHTADSVTTEIDILGNEIRRWYASRRPQGALSGAVPIDVQALHHQPHQTQDGFLALSANMRLIENYYSSETDPRAPRRTQPVVGDRIIEFNSAGEILWSWDAFDHLDPFRIGYLTFDPYWHTRGFPNALDWTHGNGVSEDPRDGNILVLLRLQSAVLKIDRETGEIMWILGADHGWSPELRAKLLRPVGEPFRMFFYGHNPRITPQGTLTLYDNGLMQAFPFDPPLPPHLTFARGVEYEIDEQAMTVRQVWASHDKLSEDSCFSWAMGDSWRLPTTGNMLVDDAICAPRAPNLTYEEWNTPPGMRHVDEQPYWGRVREYDHATRDVVFEMVVQDPFQVLQWEVYGVQRVTSLYPRARSAP
jgi:hypothetical protein